MFRPAFVWVAVLTLGLAPFAATAETAEAGKTKELSPADGQRYDIWFIIDHAREDMTELAEAVPAEKYTFRPVDGVRKFGEIYMHVAEGNYNIASLWGKKPPAGVEPKDWEKEGADKAKVVERLKNSFQFLHDSIAELSDADLDRTIQIYDHPGRLREALLFVLSHNHVHLGQSIAYARAAGVTPPWTAWVTEQRQKMEKEKAEREKQEQQKEKEKEKEKPPHPEEPLR